MRLFYTIKNWFNVTAMLYLSIDYMVTKNSVGRFSIFYRYPTTQLFVINIRARCAQNFWLSDIFQPHSGFQFTPAPKFGHQNLVWRKSVALNVKLKVSLTGYFLANG